MHLDNSTMGGVGRSVGLLMVRSSPCPIGCILTQSPSEQVGQRYAPPKNSGVTHQFMGECPAGCGLTVAALRSQIAMHTRQTSTILPSTMHTTDRPSQTWLQFTARYLQVASLTRTASDARWLRRFRYHQWLTNSYRSSKSDHNDVQRLCRE